MVLEFKCKLIQYKIATIFLCLLCFAALHNTYLIWEWKRPYDGFTQQEIEYVTFIRELGGNKGEGYHCPLSLCIHGYTHVVHYFFFVCVEMTSFTSLSIYYSI